jgi:hypothetical protein
MIPIEPIAQFNLAVKQVLDLDSWDMSTLWEMIPFSWLIDYFVNIQDRLLAIESTEHFLPKHICIMQERVSINTYINWQNDRPDVTETPPPGRGAVGWNNGSTANLHRPFVQRTPPSGVTTTRWHIRSVYETGDIGHLLSFSFFSETQAVNILALIAVLAKRKK